MCPLFGGSAGIKVWTRAEAFSGYMSAFQVYTGKQGDITETGLGAKVVKSLTGDLNGSHRHLFFYNYFSTVDLLLDLHQDGLYGCGTLSSKSQRVPPAVEATSEEGVQRER